MAILLIALQPGSHPLIYAATGIFFAIAAWHIQTLIRTQKLKKQWKRRSPLTQSAPAETEPAFKAASTAKLLDEANFAGVVPASVTEHTTSHLVKERK